MINSNIGALPPALSEATEKRSTVSKYVLLDVARALAAIFVLADHLRSFVFADLRTVGKVGMFWKAFYLGTSLGQEAVMVFFVLSGFLITKNISQLYSTGQWSWSQYAMKRLSRLWIVLVPALVLTFIWDHLGMTLTGSALYSGNMNDVYHNVPMTASSYTVLTAFGNLFFVQNFLVPAFGSNGPLWSLSNEFWYYAIFPLGFFALRGQTALLYRIIFAVAIIGLCFWLPRTLVLMGLVWLMGYVVYLLLPMIRLLPMRSNILLLSLGIVTMLVGVLLTKSGWLQNISSSYSTGLGFSLVLIALTQLRAPRWLEPGATVFSDFSYTLYLVHFPFLAFAFSYIFHNTRQDPGLRAAATYAVAFAAAIAYAFFVYWLFERHTTRIQANLSRHLASRHSVNAAVST